MRPIVSRHLTAVLCSLFFAHGTPALGMNNVQSYTLESIKTQCIEFKDIHVGSEDIDIGDCRVSKFGVIGSVDGQTLYFALYCIIPNDALNKDKCDSESFSARYYRERGLAIFVRDNADEQAQLLFERANLDVGLFYYEQPRLVNMKAGTMLYLPIVLDGTGHGNASEYYLWQDKQWRMVESHKWLIELGKRIPVGLAINKGIWPDFQTMKAEAPLYRHEDCNSCPSGGTVQLTLDVENNEIVIKAAVFSPRGTQ